MKIGDMTKAAVLAAVLCAAAPFAIPLGPVPLSLATFVIYLAAGAAGWKTGTLATVLYICIGAAGIPVFSGFQGGPGVLLGPTGGYLIGYVLCALVTGLLAHRCYMPGMVLGTAACYLCGTVWYVISTGLPVLSALALCVLPFLPGDAVKIIAAAALCKKLKKALHTKNRRS